MEFYTHQLPTTDVIQPFSQHAVHGFVPGISSRHHTSRHPATAIHSHSIRPFSSNAPPSLRYPFNGAGPVPSNDEVDLERTASIDIDLDFPVPVAEIDHIEEPGTNCSRGPGPYFVPQDVLLIFGQPGFVGDPPAQHPGFDYVVIFQAPIYETLLEESLFPILIVMLMYPSSPLLFLFKDGTIFATSPLKTPSTSNLPSNEELIVNQHLTQQTLNGQNFDHRMGGHNNAGAGQQAGQRRRNDHQVFLWIWLAMLNSVNGQTGKQARNNILFAMSCSKSSLGLMARTRITTTVTMTTTNEDYVQDENESQIII
ncbi:hypothetical protein JOM56_007837 [Amanita muscaria]